MIEPGASANDRDGRAEGARTKELWLAEYRYGGEAGGGGSRPPGEDRPFSILEPFYARDEAEARRIVYWQMRTSPRPLALTSLRHAPEGFRIRRAHLPGRLPCALFDEPELDRENSGGTLTTWLDDDLIALYMAWFARHGCVVERLASGHFRVSFPPGTRFEESRLLFTEEQHITITLPDGAVAEELRLIRDDPTYNLLLIDPDL